MPYQVDVLTGKLRVIHEIPSSLVIATADPATAANLVPLHATAFSPSGAGVDLIVQPAGGGGGITGPLVAEHNNEGPQVNISACPYLWHKE